MIETDFVNQPYIAELLKMDSNNAQRTPSVLRRLPAEGWSTDSLDESSGLSTVIHHGFIASAFPYHRSVRNKTSSTGKQITIPRTKTIRGRDHFLYDLLLVRRGEHVVVAVPFHALAARVFLQIDSALAGTGTLYEKLNINNMVIRLGEKGRMPTTDPIQGASEIVVTRCHLAYSDSLERTRDLEQVRLTGSNLGASEIYSHLIAPVLKPKTSRLEVTPILLGFALVRGGVRKAGAITDRHGNFKFSVGPGLRQVTRVFQLLEEVERIRGVVFTTANVPILQSRVIEGDE
jgi:hypothetical protein